jgi:hypothetical protein
MSVPEEDVLLIIRSKIPPLSVTQTLLSFAPLLSMRKRAKKFSHGYVYWCLTGAMLNTESGSME